MLATNANGVVAGKGRVVLDIAASDSGYSNRIYFSTDNFKTRQYVGIDNETGTVDLGTFKRGTTIQFGIDNGQGDFFRTGGKSANVDKVDHTKVSKLADGGVRVGFEDLRGGGGRDFNDAIIGAARRATGTGTHDPTPGTSSAAYRTARSVRCGRSRRSASRCCPPGPGHRWRARKPD